MALESPVVTVTDVTEPQSGLYRIAFNMVATDDVPALPGLNVAYTINYKHGNDVSLKVAEVIRFFQLQINRYKRAVAVATSGELATARASIQSGLVV